MKIADSGIMIHQYIVNDITMHSGSGCLDIAIMNSGIKLGGDLGEIVECFIKIQ